MNYLALQNLKKFILFYIFLLSFLTSNLIVKFKIIYKKQFNKNYNNYIYNKLNYNKNLNYIKKLKKVVYTVILGGYDKIKSFNKQKGYDFYLFTDNILLYKNITTNWTIMIIPENIKNLKLTVVKKQRFIKLHPHLFFKEYNISIYIDASLKIRKNLDEFLLRIMSPKYYIYTLEHPERNSIFKEIKKVLYYKKENKSIGNLIYKRYKKEKFPDDKGLIESCILIRIHNDKKCIKIMNKWFYEIERYSHRDQLSFNYINWKNNISIKYISKNYALKYFKNYSNHFKNIFYSL